MSNLQQQLEMLEFRRFKNRKENSRHRKIFDDAAGAQELNLVAMMDMFTILLVFLLKSYSVSAMSIPVGENRLSVPMSSHTINPIEAVKLIITRMDNGEGVIAVDANEVITLDDATLSTLKTNASNRKYLIDDLKVALQAEADKIKKLSLLNPEITFDHKIMVISDKDVPYWLMTSVLFTSADAGFDQYNLVALRESQ